MVNTADSMFMSICLCHEFKHHHDDLVFISTRAKLPYSAIATGLSEKIVVYLHLLYKPKCKKNVKGTMLPTLMISALTTVTELVSNVLRYE